MRTSPAALLVAALFATVAILALAESNEKHPSAAKKSDESLDSLKEAKKRAYSEYVDPRLGKKAWYVSPRLGKKAWYVSPRLGKKAWYVSPRLGKKAWYVSPRLGKKAYEYNDPRLNGKRGSEADEVDME